MLLFGPPGAGKSHAAAGLGHALIDAGYRVFFIATGWTECLAMPFRSGAFVLEHIERVSAALPFPLRGLDCDNDSAFMNAAVFDFCKATGIELTRSRAYKKNDQAWVEQKNGSVVRRLVG
ncbi:ATP-binding protein, partial [Caballeronia glebae]|uniref:ATP-binding protein n=1 Tax=Caballeronia glebae TaxID=1777143 RepID=UPI000A4A3FF8